MTALLLFAVLQTAGLARETVYDAERPHPLTRVMSATPTDAGGLLVADVMTKAIIRFDSTGAQLRALRRDGRGPGEFQFVIRTGMVGDTIWAVDQNTGSISLFTSDGEYLRAGQSSAVSVPQWPDFPEGFRPEALLPGAVLGTVPNRGAPPAYLRGQVRIVSARGAHTIATYDLTRSRLLLQGPSGSTSYSTFQPFDDTQIWAVSGDGTRIVVVTREWSGDAGDAYFRVELYEPTGRKSSDVACAYRPERITRSARNAAIEKAATDNLSTFNGNGRAARKAAEEALRLPEYDAPVDMVAVSNDGHVWLRDKKNPRRWGVIAPTGNDRFGVVTDETLRIHAAQGEHVWASSFDDDDRITFARYRVPRQRVVASPWQCAPRSSR